MSPEIIEGLAYRLIGDVAGTCMALAFLPPKTLRGFLQRTIVSLISGMTFAGYVRDWGGFAKDGEGVIAAAAIAAVISWGAMGRIRRAVDTAQLPKLPGAPKTEEQQD